MIQISAILIAIVLAYLIYISRGAILIVLIVLGLGYFWHANFGTKAALLDKAYYCDLLGPATGGQAWDLVLEWTRFDERMDPTTKKYQDTFINASCEEALAYQNEHPGDYGKIDETHEELGYIYRYFYYRNGKVVGLYRDNDQFLWQRALTLRIDADCNLDRVSGACVSMPSEERCSWADVRGYGSSYRNDKNGCSFDTTGKSQLHKIQDSNFIRQTSW